MKNIVVFLSLIVMSCSTNAPKPEATTEAWHEQHDTTTVKTAASLQLNKGAKWKTDAPTSKNVAAMVTVLKDSSNLGVANKARLEKQLQMRIDTLVRECRMEGPDHDALHVWLQQVLQDLKEMKDGSDYPKSLAYLKKDVENFYVFFE
jgi:hypothetical protein